MKEYFISKASEYTSITDVLKIVNNDTSSDQITILIGPGTYYEKVEITRGNLIIKGTGDSPSDTIITFDDCATAIMPDGSKRGTFRSYSMLIDAGNITVSNLTISNTSGDEHIAGQAIALYADGDNLIFDNIRLESRQDTLFTGPLPPKEIKPGGFIGPKQYAPRINGHHLYKNCYICGNIDFIFGSATAYFEECTIESISHGDEPVQGYVTAASTPEGQEFGYIFEKCSFISSECGEGTCYLARPWRDYAKTIFIDCTIGKHICQEGFHDWNKPAARENAFYATLDCVRDSGEQFIPTAEFAKLLDLSSKNKYNKSVVFSDNK